MNIFRYGIISSISTAITSTYRFNFGGTGGAPTNPGWHNVWGEPYVDANLATDVDFLNIVDGISIKCVNTDSAHAWGEFGNTAISNQGETSGIYPSTVVNSYWFVRNRIATIEITGARLSGTTWSCRLFGSRSNAGAATGPRVVKYNVNTIGVQNLECFQNTGNTILYTGVTNTGGKITVTVEDNVEFGYLNAMILTDENP